MFVQSVSSKILSRIRRNINVIPRDSSQPTASRGDDESRKAEIVQVRVESAARRDELRKLEDRQRILLQQVQRLV